MNENDPADVLGALKEGIENQVDIRPLLSRLIHNFGGLTGLADELHTLYKQVDGHQTKVRLMSAMLSLIEKATDTDADELPDDPAELKESIVAVLRDMQPDERAAIMQDLGVTT